MNESYIYRMKIRWLQIVGGAVVIILLLVLLIPIPPTLLLVASGFVASMYWLWREGDRFSHYVWFLAGLLTGSSFSVFTLILMAR